MLTHGGCEAAPNVRCAVETLVAALCDGAEGLTFPEIAELERDAYGRVLVFVRVQWPEGNEESFGMIYPASQQGQTHGILGKEGWRLTMKLFDTFEAVKFPPKKI